MNRYDYNGEVFEYRFQNWMKAIPSCLISVHVLNLINRTSTLRLHSLALSLPSRSRRKCVMIFKWQLSGSWAFSRCPNKIHLHRSHPPHNVDLNMIYEKNHSFWCPLCNYFIASYQNYMFTGLFKRFKFRFLHFPFQLWFSASDTRFREFHGISVVAEKRGP